MKPYKSAVYPCINQGVKDVAEAQKLQFPYNQIQFILSMNN